MVDLVARIVADDNDRVLSFKASEVIFGGGRLTVHNKESPKRKKPRPLILKMWKMLNGRRLAILMVHGHRAAVKQMIPTLWGRRSRKPCPNALMGNGSSSSSTTARVKSPFAPTLMPATVATRKAALMLAPCGIVPRTPNLHPRWM